MRGRPRCVVALLVAAALFASALLSPSLRCLALDLAMCVYKHVAPVDVGYVRTGTAWSSMSALVDAHGGGGWLSRTLPTDKASDHSYAVHYYDSLLGPLRRAFPALLVLDAALAAEFSSSTWRVVDTYRATLSHGAEDTADGIHYRRASLDYTRQLLADLCRDETRDVPDGGRSLGVRGRRVARYGRRQSRILG